MQIQIEAVFTRRYQSLRFGRYEICLDGDWELDVDRKIVFQSDWGKEIVWRIFGRNLHLVRRKMDVVADCVVVETS